MSGIGGEKISMGVTGDVSDIGLGTVWHIF
jgi:hypothetical protein